VQSDVRSIGDLSSSTGACPEVEVFTTRPDTLFGVAYIALSLTHPLVQQAAAHSAELRSFLAQAKSFPSDSKAGFRVPNVTAINPMIALPNIHKFLGDNAYALPVYAAPYVLDHYGTGAIMGVPGHDSRDLAFWRAQNLENPVPLVISPTSGRQPTDPMLRADTLEEA
jgi:leucyl-tRNA synthetase